MRTPTSLESDAWSAERLGNTGGGREKGKKRQKYVSRACIQCKRRKVKCSGEDACRQCRARNITCRYSLAPAAAPNTRDAVAPTAPSVRPALVSPTGNTTPTSSAQCFTASADPRIDGLCDRVRALEHALAHLLKSAKVSEETPRSQPFSASIRPADVIEDDDDNANQFVVDASANNDVSLSSQVAAMSALLSTPPSPKPGTQRPNSRGGLLVELPDPPLLQHLLDVYFHDFDGYFPFLDRHDNETRICRVIHDLGYSSYNCIVVVTPDRLPTVALACIMLALAECLDPSEGACDGDTKPGWERYLQYRCCVQRCSYSRPLDLDIISAQALAAAYLMHCEALGPASHAITVVWQLATSARLHNQRVWPTLDPNEVLQRQRLWWTIYFLDRQISRRSGMAYHIRDTEFSVDDFTQAEHTATSSAMAPIDQSRSITEAYMQALINLARLWGNVWDTFFAVGATKKVDWMEVEIMDARILNARRQLPSTLTWDSDELATYTLTGEGEPHIRRRLQLYTRLDLLRMLIRQNPVRQAVFVPETAHVCSRLARGVIRAHELFISQDRGARAAGYFTTSSIVECIYHLAPVLHYSQDAEEHAACVAAFSQAHGILVRLSPYNKVADKALKALNGVVKKWSSSNIVEDGDDACRLSNVASQNLMSCTPRQVSASNTDEGHFGAEGVSLDLGDWMDTSLGSLFGNDFANEVDFQLDT